MRKPGDLQVWWIPQVPMDAFDVDVATVAEGVKIMGVLAKYDQFRLDNRVNPDYCNAGGLRQWCEDSDGEGTPGWEDWYDEATGSDDPEQWLEDVMGDRVVTPQSGIDTARVCSELVAMVKPLLRYAENNTCDHTETYRGGAIWEICSSCGAKWADDEGGRPEWQETKEITDARNAIDLALAIGREEGRKEGMEDAAVIAGHGGYGFPNVEFTAAGAIRAAIAVRAACFGEGDGNATS